MKSILEILEVVKLPFLAIAGALLFFLGKFEPSKSAKIIDSQNSEALDVQKLLILRLQIR